MIDPKDHRVHMKRTGVTRLGWALVHSLAGLKAGYDEPAFRFQLRLGAVMLPASLWLGQDWVETAVLAGSVLVVMVAEMLNTAIEAVVDLVTDEWNALAKRAKDTGSAAVLLAMVWCAGTWVGAIGHRWEWW